MTMIRSLPAAALIAAIALAAAGAVPATRGDDAAASEFRVMTFNIRYGTAKDGDDAWERRSPLVLGLLRERSAEIVGLQEALRFQLDAIEGVLPTHVALGVGRDDGASQGEHATLLVARDRFEVLASGTFWLSPSPDVPGSRGWGATLPRICTWARLRDRRDGRTLLVANVHLDHQSRPAREHGVETVAARLAARREPGDAILVMGDFNAAPGHDALRWLRGDVDRLPHHAAPTASPIAFDDAWTRAGRDESGAGTFNGFRGDRDGDRIDHLLLERGAFAVVSASILHDSEGGRFPSDHFPVAATIRLAPIAP